MRKDRIMMHERRKNRRTDGKKERILPLPETEPKVKVEAEEMEPAREATLRKRKRRKLSKSPHFADYNLNSLSLTM